MSGFTTRRVLGGAELDVSDELLTIRYITPENAATTVQARERGNTTEPSHDLTIDGTAYDADDDSKAFNLIGATVVGNYDKVAVPAGQNGVMCTLEPVSK